MAAEETEKAPSEDEALYSVRPKGFEPLTFWSVVCVEDLLVLWAASDVLAEALA
ncbi:hypothetical protein EV379_3102 [Microterricola gilva]|uniref:Uncharacterized protein n=1 Tax=Microterricola gilva TaxID=393267 RepID=A0A4V2GB46_9MICO|nr:hypothetical protein EV379_3102 [Microterricola gilva]